MGHSKGSPEREVHCYPALTEKDRNISNNLTLHLQEVKEQQQRLPRVSIRKEITKIRAELNNTETKTTIQRINKSRSWSFEKIKQNQQGFKQIH